MLKLGLIWKVYVCVLASQHNLKFENGIDIKIKIELLVKMEHVFIFLINWLGILIITNWLAILDLNFMPDYPPLHMNLINQLALMTVQ